MNFSIIIPNYNGAKFLPDCLESLYQAIKNCPNSKFEVILVDNGSKDNSVEIFKSIITQNSLPYLRTEICHLISNHGFAYPVNHGINKSTYDWVALLNNDLTMNPDWFNLIADAILNNTDPKTAVYTGTVLNKDGTHYESQGLDFKIIGKCNNISNGSVFLRSAICHLTSDYIWGASAAFTVYNKPILQKIGLFDQNFFAYEEDVDLSLRLSKLNYKTLYIPQALSYHLGGGTSGKMGNFRSRHDFKNWIYIIIKNYSRKEILDNYPQLFTERLRNLSGLIKNTINSYGLKSIYILPKDLIKTFLEILIHVPIMLQKRRQFSNLLKSNQ